MRVFGMGLLNRAMSDLESAGEVLGFSDFNLERDARTIALTLHDHDPFEDEDTATLTGLHNVIATMINSEGGPNGMFMIPNYRIPRRYRRCLPVVRRFRSAWESKSARYTLAVRDRLLAAAHRSGVYEINSATLAADPDVRPQPHGN